MTTVKGSGHASDCAVHNAPAERPGVCNCGQGAYIGPSYSAQSSEPEHLPKGEKHREWRDARLKEAHDNGCIATRVTFVGVEDVVLVEGWTFHAPERPTPFVARAA